MSALDARLLCAASFVRAGAVFCDVGTDHAYLPIHLTESGRVCRALATDVRKGPLSAAREHIAAAGLSDRIRTVLTDGLAGLADEGITDIAICGMGGELIARILSDAPFVKDGNVRLILQPMSRPAAARRFLAENGFAVDGERLCRAGGRVYSCLCAHYTAIPYEISPARAEIGRPTLDGEGDALLFTELLCRRIAIQREKLSGLLQGGQSALGEEALLQELLQIQQEVR